VTDGFRTML